MRKRRGRRVCRSGEEHRGSGHRGFTGLAWVIRLARLARFTRVTRVTRVRAARFRATRRRQLDRVPFRFVGTAAGAPRGFDGGA